MAEFKMRLFGVRQRLVTSPLADIRAEVHRQLDGVAGSLPQGEIALTVGSRGIRNLPLIVRAAGDWVRARGRQPFIVPCMGSHNGATAAGQRAMIESLGITEAAMEMPIRASMECVHLGDVACGPVWMDRYCHEAGGVLVINRVKLHTCFSGPVQSGLLKMIVVGMGKIASAQTFHSAPTDQMPHILLEMGRYLLDTGRIWAGLAILEDGCDDTAELHAVPAAAVLQREPDLLQRHLTYFPRLPVDELNVLIVDEIGKIYSGTGMDTNVIGYRGVKGFEDLDKPRIRIIAALSLADGSQGNALGVGLADFITARLRASIDEQKTLINAFTTGDMERAKIPATLSSDEELIQRLRERYGTQRWMIIPNTLHLEHLFVSEDLCPEVALHPRCEMDPQPLTWQFVQGRHQLPFKRDSQAAG